MSSRQGDTLGFAAVYRVAGGVGCGVYMCPMCAHPVCLCVCVWICICAHVCVCVLCVCVCGLCYMVCGRVCVDPLKTYNPMLAASPFDLDWLILQLSSPMAATTPLLPNTSVQSRIPAHSDWSVAQSFPFPSLSTTAHLVVLAHGGRDRLHNILRHAFDLLTQEECTGMIVTCLVANVLYSTWYWIMPRLLRQIPFSALRCTIFYQHSPSNITTRNTKSVRREWIWLSPIGMLVPKLVQSEAKSSKPPCLRGGPIPPLAKSGCPGGQVWISIGTASNEHRVQSLVSKVFSCNLS